MSPLTPLLGLNVWKDTGISYSQGVICVLPQNCPLEWPQGLAAQALLLRSKLCKLMLYLHLGRRDPGDMRPAAGH